METIAELMKDGAFNAKLSEAKDIEEIAQMFKAHGIDTSAEALKQLFAMGDVDRELDETSLESVAGGISGKWPWNSRQDRANRLEIAYWLGRATRRSLWI